MTDDGALQTCKVNLLLFFSDVTEHEGTDTLRSFRANTSNVSLNPVPLSGSASLINGTFIALNTKKITKDRAEM